MCTSLRSHLSPWAPLPASTCPPPADLLTHRSHLPTPHAQVAEAGYDYLNAVDFQMLGADLTVDSSIDGQNTYDAFSRIGPQGVKVAVCAAIMT